MYERLITDNVLVAFEIMHHINQKRGEIWKNGIEVGYE